MTQSAIHGRVFIVTGATSGLGFATARMLSHEGAFVIGVGRNRVAGDVLELTVPRVRFVGADVTNESDAQRVVNIARSRSDAIHGLINCAGIAPAAKVVGNDGPHSLGLFSNVVTTNLVGTFNMIRTVAAAMAQQSSNGDDEDRGVIINTASVAAFDGQIGQAAYAASKGGIVAMTLPMARELARYNIRVVTIAPGVFDTPMVASFPDKVKKSLTAAIPCPRRFGRPDEFAAMVKHVCENRMLNGETTRLDGALRMGAR